MNLNETEELKKFREEIGKELENLMLEKKGDELILSDFGFLCVFCLAFGFLYVIKERRIRKNEKKDKK